MRRPPRATPATGPCLHRRFCFPHNPTTSWVRASVFLDANPGRRPGLVYHAPSALLICHGFAPSRHGIYPGRCPGLIYHRAFGAPDKWVCRLQSMSNRWHWANWWGAFVACWHPSWVRSIRFTTRRLRRLATSFDASGISERWWGEFAIQRIRRVTGCVASGIGGRVVGQLRGVCGTAERYGHAVGALQRSLPLIRPVLRCLVRQKGS